VVSDILNAAFELYQKHWRHLMSVALTYFLIVPAITLALTIAFGRVGAAVGAFVALVGNFWLVGALVESVADIRDGRADLTLTETFQRVGPRVLPLLGASILAGLGIALGLLLLIVPGLILLTWWSMITAVIVLERKGVFESFGRSRELVRGNGWSVFGLLVITYLLVVVVSGIVGAIFAWLPAYASNYFGSVIGGTLTAPFAALAITLMYFRLRGGESEPTATAPAPSVAEPEPR
jgi:hypothetical protein